MGWSDVRSFTLKYDFHILFIMYFFLALYQFCCNLFFLWTRWIKGKMPYSNVTIIIHRDMNYHHSVMHFGWLLFMLCSPLCFRYTVGSCSFFSFPPTLSLSRLTFIHVNTYFSIWSENSSRHELEYLNNETPFSFGIVLLLLDHIPNEHERREKKTTRSKRNEANANIFCKNLIKMRATQPVLAHSCDACAENVN